MARSLDDAITRAKNALHGGTRFAWLFQFDRDGTSFLRLTDHPTALTYKGASYTPAGLQIEGIAESPGQFANFRATVSNIDGVAQGFLQDGEILNRRHAVRLITVDQSGLTTGAAYGWFHALQASADRDRVTLTLGLWPLSAVSVPRDRFLRTKCRWVFKSTECGYSGALTTCTKAYVSTDGCSGRSNQPRYGGFPFLLTGREAMGILGV